MNNLVDEYNNTYHLSSGGKPIYADYSALTREIESSHKAPKFKVEEKFNITYYKNILSRGYNKNWSKRIFGICYELITNPWKYKIKDLNGGTIIGSLYEKKMLLSIL